MYGCLIKQSDKFIHKLKSTNIGSGVTSKGKSVFYIDKFIICVGWLFKMKETSAIVSAALAALPFLCYAQCVSFRQM